MDTGLAEVPRLAADRIVEKGWWKGGWVGPDGQECMHQAVRACSPVPGDGYIVSAVLEAHGYPLDWNDADARTDAEVLAALHSFDVTDAALEATFGPQWRVVVALIRQAATLTREQAAALAAAPWDAAGRAAGRAAGAAAWRAAPWDAAWSVAWSAAWGAAPWDAAWSVAWDAAGAAAWALVLADLVGQHGLEQHHIDALLAPWISVMGDPREAAPIDGDQERSDPLAPKGPVPDLVAELQASLDRAKAAQYDGSVDE